MRANEFKLHGAASHMLWGRSHYQYDAMEAFIIERGRNLSHF